MGNGHERRTFEPLDAPDEKVLSTEVLTPRRGQDRTSLRTSTASSTFPPKSPEPVSREVIYPWWGVGPGGGREPPFLEEGPQDTSREDLSPEDLSFVVSHSR